MALRIVETSSALSEGQLQLLRALVTNPDMRASFMAGPTNALAVAERNGLKLTPTEWARFEKLTPTHLEQLAHGVGELMKANEGCTHTLVYAIIVALLLE